jgi:hypothetical protein
MRLRYAVKRCWSTAGDKTVGELFLNELNRRLSDSRIQEVASVQPFESCVRRKRTSMVDSATEWDETENFVF